MKFSLSKSLILSASVMGILVACGDDSNSTDATSETKTVSTVKGLGECSEDNKDEIVFVTKADADYLCNGKTWEIVKDDAESSASKSGKSSASKSKSSASKSNSSDSKSGSAKTDDEDDDEKSATSSSSKTTKSSASKTATSSAGDTSASDSDGKNSSTDSKNSGSSGKSSAGDDEVESSSSEAEDIDVVAKVIDDAPECDESNEDMVVYVQKDDAVYKCDGEEYKEIEYDFDESSSSTAGDSKDDDDDNNGDDGDNMNGAVKARCTTTITDKRDGREYCTTEIGAYQWTSENMRAIDEEMDPEGTYCYGDKSENCEKYGRLYTWEAAKYACPEGFSLPTIDDWKLADEFLVDANKLSDRSTSMRYSGEFSKYGFEMNTYGDFSAGEFGEGPGFINEIYYSGISGSAPFWSADEITKDTANHWYWYFMDGRVEQHEEYHKPKSYAFSVRCLKLVQDKCTSKNEGTVAKGENDFVVCSEGKWHKASIEDQIKYDIGTECDESGIKQGKTKSDYYVCRDGEWNLSTVAAFETQGVVCNKTGKVVTGKTRKDQYYICDTGTWRDANVVERNTYNHECNDYHQDGQIIRGDIDTTLYFVCRAYESISEAPSNIVKWWNATAEQTDIGKNTYGYECKMGVLFKGKVDKDHYYTCDNRISDHPITWKRATDLQVDTFGEECKASVILKGNVNKDKEYACNQGVWQLANDMDYDVEGQKCEAGKIVAGKVNKDAYYLCGASGNSWSIADEMTRDINGYECEDGKLYKGQVNTDKLYSCGNTGRSGRSGWHEATETDLETEGNTCEPDKVVAGKVNEDQYFICRDYFYGNYWEKASTIEMDTYGYERVPGKIYKGKVNTDKDYVFDSNFNEWRIAKQVDYDVEGVKCDAATIGYVHKVEDLEEDRYYTCRGTSWEASTLMEKDIYGYDCDGKIYAGQISTDKYYTCDVDFNEWRKADAVEVLNNQGTACDEELDGKQIRAYNFEDAAYCKDGEFSLYFSIINGDSQYINHLLKSKSYAIKIIEPVETQYLEIDCVSKIDSGSLTSAETVSGTLNGEKADFSKGVEVSGVSIITVDSDYSACYINAVGVGSTGGI